MKKGQDKPAGVAELRRRAEARLREKQSSQRSEVGDQSTAEETQRLVHELEVHQIQLEMQNEELQRTRGEVEAILAQYTDLYDFAPVGYFTLGRDGAIRRVNLTGASLLGVERIGLSGRRFGLFVSEEARPAFNAFLDKVFASQAKETCEVALLKEGHEPLWACIECKSHRGWSGVPRRGGGCHRAQAGGSRGRSGAGEAVCGATARAASLEEGSSGNSSIATVICKISCKRPHTISAPRW